MKKKRERDKYFGAYKYWSSVLISLVLICFVAIFPSCSPSEESTGRALQSGQIDLINSISAGKQLTDTGHIDLSSNWRHFYMQKGWSRIFKEKEGESFIVAAAANRTQMFFNVNTPSDRWFTFKCKLSGLLGTVRKQQFEVLCNGKRIESITTSSQVFEERNIPIKSKILKEGVNLIEFQFTDFTVNKQFDYDKRNEIQYSIPGVAAYFCDLAFSEKHRRIAPKEPFFPEQEAIRISTANHVIRQLHNSSISYTFDFPPSSSLHLEGLAQPPAGDGKFVGLALRYRKIGTKSWQNLGHYRFQFDPETRQIPIDIYLQLTDLWNCIAELKISVESTSRHSRAQIIWKKIEINRPAIKIEPGEKTAESKQRGDIKHVVIILLDAARADSFGCYGAESGATPRIDSFAGQSLVFENVVAPAPYTIASISSLFSGLLPETHGVRNNDSYYSEELPSLARGFKSAGFRTLALYGNGYASPEFGVVDGCDESVWLRGDKTTSEMVVERIQQNLQKTAEHGTILYIHSLDAPA